MKTKAHKPICAIALCTSEAVKDDRCAEHMPLPTVSLTMDEAAALFRWCVDSPYPNSDDDYPALCDAMQKISGRVR